MEPQTVIHYELVNLETNESFFTRDRDEAIKRLKERWLVFERQITACSPSLYTQAHMVITIQWHNNPEFRGEMK